MKRDPTTIRRNLEIEAATTTTAVAAHGSVSEATAPQNTQASSSAPASSTSGKSVLDKTKTVLLAPRRAAFRTMIGKRDLFSKGAI